MQQKRNRQHLRTIIAVIFIVYTVILTGCGAATDSELKAAVAELIPKAHSIYSIVYGDSLPHGETASQNGYYRIDASTGFTTVSSLKAAILEVCSPDYAEVLYNTAFSGVSQDEGAIDAKFVEQDGSLWIKPEVTSDFASPRLFDAESVEIIKKNRYLAQVRLTPTDGSEAVEVTLRLCNGTWLLDSALY